MSFEVIENPTKTSAEARMAIAQQVDQCVKWLKINGFEVHGVERCGRIHIRTSPLCEQLEGAIAGFSRGPRGVQRYKTVIRFDCEVRWIDGGAQ